MLKYEKSIVDGLSVEELAVKRIRDVFNVPEGDCERTDKDIDKYCHTDIIWKAPNGVCTIDVKSAREMRRNDGKGKRYDGTWFELVGNTGHPGSATCQVEQLRRYGIDADKRFDYIMCESNEDFLFFRRDQLSERLNEMIRGKPVSTTNPCVENVPYTRKKWGHDDLSVFVLYDKISDLIKFKIPKHVD